MLDVVILGLLTGGHAANWGAYKDVPYEGWRLVSYLRSIVVGGALAVLLLAFLGRDALPPLVVLAGILYTLERFCTEWWKSIVREDDQDAYTIPMRFGVGGRPVDSRPQRYVVGVGVVLGIALLCLLGSELQDATESSSLILAVVVGGVGGWLTAVGGAWKDAPVEGFSGWKFLRSPVVATAWAIPLSAFTRDWLVLALAAAGFAVASIETYKTFLTGGRAPGKFEGKPVRHSSLPGRRFFAMAHATLWCAFAAAAMGAGPASQAIQPSMGRTAAAISIFLFAGLAALSVLWAVLRLPDVVPTAPVREASSTGPRSRPSTTR